MKRFLLFVLCAFYIGNAFSQNKISVTEYIEKYKFIAMEEMIKNKIPASITLAQGILESASGNSELAVNANNHFGIKCKSDWTGEKYYYDDDEKNECFRKYKSDTASYLDHSLFLKTRQHYAFLFQLEITDYKGWAHGLKKAGYATNPKYAELLIKIIEENNLSRFDTLALSYSSTKDIYQNNVIASKESKTNLKPTDTTTNKSTVTTNQTNKEQNKTTSQTTSDFPDIVLSETKRKIYTNNGVNYVLSHKNDTYYAIGKDFGLSTYEIMQYNDVKKQYILPEGEIVYIEPKKRSSKIEYHIVQEGETMHYISQKYAIQLQALYKKNNMIEGSEPKAGDKIWLKNTKPKD